MYNYWTIFIIRKAGDLLLTQNTNSLDGFIYDLRLYIGMSFPQPHLHRSAELIHVVSGRVELTVNSSVSAVNAGESALVLPYRLHSFECGEDTICAVHVFSHDCAPEFYRLLGNRSSADPVFVPDADSAACYLRRFGADPSVCASHSREVLPLGHTFSFGDIQPELTAKAPEISSGTRLGLISALEGILSGFLDKSDLTDRRDDSLIEKVLSYVGEHSGEDLTLASAAAAIGYEPHYLCRCMKKSIDLNFRSIVNSFRIEQAKELLGSTDIPSTEISHMCGFGSSRTFNRVFRQFTGMSPTDYRKS